MRERTAMCKHCQQVITLKPVGNHFKWFVGKEWKCPGDPDKPVRAHEPFVLRF